MASAFVAAVLAREVTDRGDIVARAAELGADLDRGAGVLVLRAAPRAAQTGEWRERVLTLALRALRSLAPGSLASAADDEVAAEIAVIVPAEDDERLARAAAGLARELDDSLSGFHLTTGRSRRSADPGRPLPGRQRGAPGGQRRRGRGPLAAGLRGHRRLPAAAAGDERGPGRARTLLRRDDRAAVQLRRAVRDRAGRHRRGLPRQRRQRRRHRQTALHPPPHRALPPGAREGALRPRRLRHRGPREARPRPQGDARPRHRLAARARPWSRAPRAARSPAAPRSSSLAPAAVQPLSEKPFRASKPFRGEDSNPHFQDQNLAC